MGLLEALGRDDFEAQIEAEFVNGSFPSEKEEEEEIRE